MAAKTTLNAKNLEALGAERLAALLIEVSTGDAAIKRRLRLELAGAQSPKEVAREVRKRLTSIARSRSFVDWQTRKALVNDLETQRRAIIDKVAPEDPAEALDLMWRFTELAGSVFDRCDDSSGTVIGVFHDACADLAAIAAAASPDPAALADQVFAAIQDNGYGQYDDLIRQVAPALGPDGLGHLKARLAELSKAPVPTPAKRDRRVIGYGAGGPLYADDVARSSRDITVKLALEAIADAEGNVDAFIAQKSDKAKTVPAVAAEIAQRLLDAGRAKEAWTAINAAATDRAGHIPFEWQATRLAVMEALGMAEEAQAFRWRCFEQFLDPSHLRDHLERLPDFDDIEAEERALIFVHASPHFHEALWFLVQWPAHERAADLVVTRSRELDGDLYHILVPAAEALDAKHPLAATLIRRALIDFSLGAARSSRYRHAARHLLECQGLAGQIDDFGAYETHEAYRARLEAEHGRKASFWSLLD
jgi:hypothetical protein